MMTFENSRAKLVRAEDHFRSHNQQVRLFLEKHHFPVKVESVPSTGLYTIKLRNPPKMPLDKWALDIGDCVNNARTALNYIASEFGGKDPADKDTQFPIYDARNNWKLGRVRSLPSWAQAFIEECQPYHHHDPHITALWILRTLSNLDKHTLPIEATAAAESLRIRFNPPDSSAARSVQIMPFAPIVDGALIATLVLQPNIGVSVQFEPQLVFAESVGLGPAICVVHALREILDDIARIISEFERRSHVEELST